MSVQANEKIFYDNLYSNSIDNRLKWANLVKWWSDGANNWEHLKCVITGMVSDIQNTDHADYIEATKKEVDVEKLAVEILVAMENWNSQLSIHCTFENAAEKLKLAQAENKSRKLACISRLIRQKI